jgi:hypothetical protein
MIDGALDVENLKVGDRVATDEECVAILHIAVIKCKGSNKLEAVPQFNCSRDFKFRDLISIIDKVKERFIQLEPTKTEMENREQEIDEYLKKIRFNPDKHGN